MSCPIRTKCRACLEPELMNEVEYTGRGRGGRESRVQFLPLHLIHAGHGETFVEHDDVFPKYDVNSTQLETKFCAGNEIASSAFAIFETVHDFGGMKIHSKSDNFLSGLYNCLRCSPSRSDVICCQRASSLG
ncbi:hypothetical protein Mapa_012349 [Marchantia paleacea]|nr:hypothetical protein Mapa_012349 [Marchantia paleacea]